MQPPCVATVWRCCLTAVLSTLLLIAPAPASAEEMIVALRVNGVNRGEAIVDAGSDGTVTLSADDAKKLGFTERIVARLRGPDAGVRLKADGTLRVQLDTGSLTLELEAPADWFAVTTVSLSSRTPVKVTQLNGWHGWLNYALDIQQTTGAAADARVDTQFVLAHGGWSLYSEQSLQGILRQPSWRRNGTTAFYDDTTLLTRFSVGDVAVNPALGTTLTRLRGLQWSRRYEIDPSIIVGPAFSWQYNVTSPSTVDVYVDQTRVRSVTVAPGPLNLADLTYFPGLRNVDVVVRNRAGVETRIAVPYYFANDMLARGKSTFDLVAGETLDSTGHPQRAAGAAGRYGMSDSLTAGAGLEARGTYRMVRVDATASHENWGQASLQIARSRGGSETRWRQATSFGYSLIRDRISVQANFLAQASEFGLDPLSPRPARMLNRRLSGAVAVAVSQRQSVSLNLAVNDYSDAGRDHVAGARLTHNWGHGMSAWLALDCGRETGRNVGSIGAGVTIGLGPRWSISSSTESRIRESGQINVRAARSGSEDGWNNLRVSATAKAGSVTTDGYAERVTPLSTITLAGRAEQRAHATELAGNARLSGAVVLADGEAWLSQTVSQAFALVDVPQVTDVRVYHNGQFAGRTGQSGRVVVPNLAAYAANQIRIDDRDIPLDIELAAVQQEITPRTLAGTAVRFANRAVVALAGTLTLRRGAVAEPVASAQLTVSPVDGALDTLLSTTDGQGGFYLDNLTPGRWRISALNRTTRCVAEIEVSAAASAFTDLGDVACHAR
ncbi:MAG: fimbrial biogenesis outer membrane usher protein [Burkholderiales bacterium]|nr:fimbrial biogenesis outer membrane usher protein [Burkholderiales bacterium]